MISVEHDLIAQIKKIVKESFSVDLDNIEFEVPNSIEHGNLSTNVALKNSKVLKQRPVNVAQEIKDKLPSNKNIEKIEVIEPGFINIYYSKEYFSEILKEILIEDIDFGSRGENINIEYVSANPTGELHLGHARGAVFGDSLAKLLSKVGYNITKEYYVNDAGVQMQNLGKSVEAFYLQNFKDAPFPEDGYRGKEIKEIANKLYEEHNTSLEGESLDYFIQYAYKYNMDEIINVLKSINVEFDVFSKEKDYHESGRVAEVVKELEEKGEVYEEDGAKWLNTSKYGDDKDRVLEKSDHTHTYLTSDIAYHDDKFKRTSGKLINIWGADHHGYVKRVEASMESLGYDISRLETIFIQMVSVLENNEKVKMSKRAGTSITIKDLLEVIPSDVLRYFFIMRSPDTQLDFDIALASEQNSQNPIFYVQYAHARVCSIIKKSNYNYDDLTSTSLDVNSNILSSDETVIISKLSLYRKVLEEAAAEKRPHILTNYIYDIATLFHKYYNNEQIIVEDEGLTKNKLFVCAAVKKIIADCLLILGIEAKESM